MRGTLDIAIAGAGVAGLAAAQLLARAGHRVVVHERFEASKPVGSGLMIQPVGLAALDRLGARAALEARGARLDGIHGLTAQGTIVFDLGYSELDPALYALGVHRAALHDVLWQGFLASGATLQTGRSLAAVETQADGRAAFIDAAGLRLPAADLLIDASGAQSVLRQAVTTARPQPFAYGAVWATVPDPGLSGARLAQRYRQAHTMIGVMPLGSIQPGGAPLAALFWSLKPSAHGAWAGAFDAWRAEAAQLWPGMKPCLDALAGPDDFTLAVYRHMTVRRPAKGPVALIGDAAHCTSPQLGQGANHGLLDAVALADAVARAADVAEALALYAAARRRQVRFYQFASAAMTPLFQSDSRTMPFLRDRIFHRMKVVPYLKREMIRTLAGLKTGLFTHATAETLAGG